MLDVVQATIAMRHYQKKLREARKLISSLRTQLNTTRIQLDAARRICRRPKRLRLRLSNTWIVRFIQIIRMITISHSWILLEVLWIGNM